MPSPFHHSLKVVEITIEVSIFRLAPGVSVDAFEQAAREATRQLRRFEGFRSRQLFHDARSGQWTDVLHWASREEARRAAEQVYHVDELGPFLRSIDPSTIQMVHGEEVDVQG